MNKHTPGPWRVIAFGDGTYRVEIHTKTEHQSLDENFQTCKWSETTENTACLISAAPDLLDALQEIVKAADGDGWTQLDASFSKARAAIAKATGGEA